VAELRTGVAGCKLATLVYGETEKMEGTNCRGGGVAPNFLVVP